MDDQRKSPRDRKRDVKGDWGERKKTARDPDNEKKSEDINWGRQVVLQLLKDSPDKVQKVFLGKNVSEAFTRQILSLADKGNMVVQRVAPEVLTEICGPVNHQGVACRIGDVPMLEICEFIAGLPKKMPLLLLLLDHIQDPQNLGAVVRTAEASGAAGVLFPKRRSALPGGTVVKVSAGAALRVPMVAVNNVSQTVKELQEAGFWTIGLDNNKGRSIWDEAMPEKVLLVVGSEGDGLSRLVAENCDEVVRIPLSGKTGSLNASVAAAVGMFEWARKWGRQS